MASMTRQPFPLNTAGFLADSRITFYEEDNEYILEDDGLEWKYSPDLNKWTPLFDEDEDKDALQLQGQHRDDDQDAQQHSKKRKSADEAQDNSQPAKSKRSKQPPAPMSERKNTAIYVTGLPKDVTMEEVTSAFSRYGVIAEEIDSGLPRIKLYTNEDGTLKGDALIVYFRTESVNLAIQMLDDTDFHLGNPDPNGGTIRVKEADFSYKKQKGAPAASSSKDKSKIIKKTQKMISKLTDWDDDDPATLKVSRKWDKVVILKHMFTLQELEEDASALADIKEEVREECVKFGEITNITLYDKELEGVISVKFKTPEAAEACIKRLHNRDFAGRKVIATIANGKEQFQKSSKNQRNLTEEDALEKERLEQFGSWIEQGDDE